MGSTANRLFVIGCLLIVLAPELALASSNYGRQGVELFVISKAIEDYYDSHNVYPLTDSQSTWFEKLVVDPVWGNYPLAFGASPGGKFPLDMYGYPLVYEPPSPSNGNQVVVRSVGLNGVDDQGRLDDLDTRWEPNIGYWYKTRWPKFFIQAWVSLGLAIVGLVVLIALRRRVRAGPIAVLWLGLIGFAATPWGLDNGVDHFSMKPIEIFFLGIKAISFFPLLAGIVWLIGGISLEKRRVRAGCCLICGYDLRGTLAAGRDACPECGARIPLAHLRPPVRIATQLNSTPAVKDGPTARNSKPETRN